MNNVELRVGVKILLENAEGKFLVMQRSKIKYPEVGEQWDIAGGRINAGDTLMGNLKREVMEETGLEISGEPNLVAAQDIIKGEKHVVRLTYVGRSNGELKLSDEHGDFKWLTMEELETLGGVDPYFKEVLQSGILAR